MNQKNKTSPEGIKAVITSNGEVYLAQDGMRTEPDFRTASGNERILIREYNTFRKADDLLWTHGKKEIMSSLSRFLRHAASMSLLVNEDGNPISLREGLSPLEVRAYSEEEDVSFSLSIPGHDENITTIIDSVALVGSELVEIITDSDEEYNLPQILKERIKKENLPLFFSILLSRFDSLLISYSNYKCTQKKPIAAQPALIFQAIDEYGYLHVIPDAHVDGFQAGTVLEKGIIRAVSISTMTQVFGFLNHTLALCVKNPKLKNHANDALIAPSAKPIFCIESSVSEYAPITTTVSKYT